jgi:hypothetical protein
MSFTVEDGTGLPDSNAYVGTAFADSYFSDRGVAAWTGDDTTKQQAIIRATDYIETVWSSRFRGQPLTTTQALAFPRDLFNGLPVQLQKATAEYALRALTATLLPDPTSDDSGLKVVSEVKKVGPIETDKTYAADQNVKPIKAYPAADMLLRQLCAPAGAIRG